MTWDDYYEKFYDWADSTRIRHLSSVDQLGDPDEVAEIMMEFSYDHKEIANRMAQKLLPKN